MLEVGRVFFLTFSRKIFLFTTLFDHPICIAKAQEIRCLVSFLWKPIPDSGGCTEIVATQTGSVSGTGNRPLSCQRII